MSSLSSICSPGPVGLQGRAGSAVEARDKQMLQAHNERNGRTGMLRVHNPECLEIRHSPSRGPPAAAGFQDIHRRSGDLGAISSETQLRLGWIGCKGVKLTTHLTLVRVVLLQRLQATKQRNHDGGAVTFQLTRRWRRELTTVACPLQRTLRGWRRYADVRLHLGDPQGREDVRPGMGVGALIAAAVARFYKP